MNFTREPIIETIISPKEGYKLSLRNSKIGSTEEISVDAVEIVSFGQALFYRSLEKSKCFLLPVTDYEVVEVRETRMVIKNASFEKNIKIGGGREHVKSTKEVAIEKVDHSVEDKNEGNSQEEATEASAPTLEQRNDRKRDRRRNKRRRMQEERNEQKTAPLQEVTGEVHTEESLVAKEEGAKERVKPHVGAFTGLIPPPPTLISETIAKYKEKGDFADKTRQASPHASNEQAPVSTVQLEEYREETHSENQDKESSQEEQPE